MINLNERHKGHSVQSTVCTSTFDNKTAINTVDAYFKIVFEMYFVFQRQEVVHYY